MPSLRPAAGAVPARSDGPQRGPADSSSSGGEGEKSIGPSSHLCSPRAGDLSAAQPRPEGDGASEKEAIARKARTLGFDSVGFTDAELPPEIASRLGDYLG